MKKVALVLAILASATVVGFAAKADSTSTVGKAYELMEYWQYGWSGNFGKMFEATGGSTYINPSTIRFDSLTLPPVGSVVSAASLTFCFNNSPPDYYEAAPGVTLVLGRVTETYTAPAGPGLTSDVPTTWTAAGQVPADATTITLTSNGQGKQFIDITSFVQYWVDHPTENFGIVVKSTGCSRYHTPQQCNNGTPDGYGGFRLDGSGDLVVTYTAGATAASALTAAPVSGSTLDFGSNYAVDGKTLTSAVTLSNSDTTGTTTLKLTGATVADPTLFSFSGLPDDVLTTSGTNFDVQFLGATIPGTYTTTLTLTTDATSGPTTATYTLTATVTRLIGDANLDKVVNFSDYLALERTFNDHVTNDTGADFNADGVINFSDYLELERHFNDHVAAVPEPMTLSLLGLGALALIRRKK